MSGVNSKGRTVSKSRLSFGVTLANGVSESTMDWAGIGWVHTGLTDVSTSIAITISISVS